MAQSTDMVISNQTMAAARAEINAIFAALLSQNSGAAEPSYKASQCFWVDISATPWVLKIYDGTDWIPFLEVNATTNKINLVNMTGGDARVEAPNIAQVQDGDFHWLGTLSGTNTLTAGLTPALDAYKAGQKFMGIAANAPTGTVTLNIDGLGAKAVQAFNAALAGAEYAAGDMLCFLYDGTQFQIISPLRAFWVSSKVQALGNVTGATTINLNSGRSVSATITGNTTFTFSNPKAAGNEDIFTLRQTNGGAYTVTWPASVDWPGGTAPTLTASGVDEICFKTLDGGTTWAAQAALDVK